MRSIFFIITILLCGALQGFGQNDAIDRFFESYQDNDDFTSVYVSPKMFQMVTKVAGEEMKGNLSDVVKDLRGLQVLHTEKNALKYYKEAIKKIPTDEYEILVKVREKDENVRIFSKSNGDVINELLVLSGGDSDFTLLSFVGNIDINKLSKLAKDLDIDGAKNLELLSDKKKK